MASGQMQKFIQHLRSVLRRQDVAGKPDGELLKRYVQDGDEGAFEALVHRHGPMVFGVCRRILRNVHDAEDAYQATFLILVRKAATVRSPAALGNWLYGVAHRTALHTRNAAIKRQAKEAEAAASTPVLEDPWADLRPMLDEELERLPTKYRMLLVLCDLEGRTRKEVAALLSLPEGTVASRLAQARTLLARCLTGRGLALSVASLAGALSSQTASACVSAGLYVSTIQAARALAADQAAGVISAAVLTITQGVLKTMLLTKLKNMTIVLTILGLISASAGGLAYHAIGREQASDTPGQIAKPGPVVKAAQDLEKQLKLTTLKLEHLQAEHEALKKRLVQVEEQLKQEPQKKNSLPEHVMATHSVTDFGKNDVQSLIKLITKTIEPETWDTSGGKGAIQYFNGSESLLVSNSVAVQQRVVELVRYLREEQTRLAKMLEKREGDPVQFVTKTYPVADLTEKDGGSLVSLICRTIEPKSWADVGSFGVIDYFPAGKSLVVRQTSEVHALVAALLDDLRKAKAAQEKK